MSRDELIAEIRAAFAGVTLGDGIGLRQGQGLDDYESEATCQKYRQRDEKLDWSSIPARELVLCHSSLSFFDAAGMRFHLPAYLIAHLRDELPLDPVYHLTNLSAYSRGKLVLLNRHQRQAVRAYLLFLQQDQGMYESRAMTRALATYWTPEGIPLEA